jgi:Family of unknown function (DUF6527)
VIVMKFRLEIVRFMPAELQPGVLYVSNEFGIAAHLCACGCGSKVRTPLGPTDWQVENSDAGPSLYPSIGNWQRCGSHYFISSGDVIWSEKWTAAQIAAGRRAEERRSRQHFERVERERPLRRAWRWLKSRFR